jgi:2-(1,2-epoxy-1,2-dihydrophenyl)acetyl-CoA isomerase
MEILDVQITDGVGHLRLHRPERANAIDLPTADAIDRAVRSFADDERVGAVLVSGAGSRFCAGGDAAAMVVAADQLAYVHDLALRLDSALLRLCELEKPVVCAVHGAVAGAGIALMLSCDVIVAAPQTRFVMAYSGIGFTPDCGASWLLPRAVGQQRALAFALTGRQLLTDEALDWGLVTDVAEDPLDHASKLAATLAAGPAAALGQTRRLIRNAWTVTRPEAGEDESHTVTAAAAQPYAQAALRRFLPPAPDITR